MLFVEKAALIISEGSTPALPQQNEMGDLGGDLKKKNPSLGWFHTCMQIGKHPGIMKSREYIY